MFRDGSTLLDLEFDTTAKGVAQFGDIAASLVSIDELLRDLASITSAGAQYREIEVISMEMHDGLKVRLALHQIPTETVKMFEDVCRELIRFRDRRPRLPALTGLSDQEARRLDRHVAALQNATIPLKRVKATIG